MKQARFILKYICHFFSAYHTKGFGVHSPFIFQFLNNVIYDRNKFYVFDEIEKIRIELLQNKQTIFVKDFGTGSDRNRKVSEIARKSLKSPKYGQLLFRIIQNVCPENILELGTSLGITTAYLAANSSKSKCITLEGSPEIIEIARDNFEKLGCKNIQIIEGDINQTLELALNKLQTIDFAFIDANHSSQAVLHYFQQCLPFASSNTVMVFDDIYWSDDMEFAWKSIKNHPKVTSTIDLFQLGIVFFNPDLNKKHYKMYY